MSFPLTGLFAAAYSPMNEDGSLNLATVKELAKLYEENGLTGVFICGTTGECHSLSVAERQQLTEAWYGATSDRLTLITHVGSNCLADAVELAEHARQTGVHGIAAMAPFFFKPNTVDALVDYCEPIAEAGGELPFYFYHIPVMTGVDLPMNEFLRQGAERMPTLAGLKFTCSDLMQLQQCLAQSDGRFDILFGHDQNLLAGLALGARGAIGSTYNYAAPVYQRVIEAYEQGDMQTAQREQSKCVEHVEVLIEHGGVATGKAIMKLIGVDCGPVRPPLRTIRGDEATEIYEKSKHLDIFSRPLGAPAAIMS